MKDARFAKLVLFVNALVPVARALLPGLFRRAMGGGRFTPSTRSQPTTGPEQQR